MKALIKILCLSSFLLSDTLVISSRDGSQTDILKNIIVEDCSIEGLNRTILYKKTDKSIIENNSNSLLGAGTSLLFSSILNLIVNNSTIESDDVDEIETFENNMNFMKILSDVSLLIASLYLLGVDNPDKTYNLETHRIDDQITLYDGIRNEVEIDCTVKESSN